MGLFMEGFICGIISLLLVGIFSARLHKNPYKIKVNDKDCDIKGYSIDGVSYFKLDDISNAVGGFTSRIENKTIIISSENISNRPADRNMTSDGIRIRFENSIPYVFTGLIAEKYCLDEKGYCFIWQDENRRSKKLCSKPGYIPLIENIPFVGRNAVAIPLNYYEMTLLPFIQRNII